MTVYPRVSNLLALGCGDGRNISRAGDTSGVDCKLRGSLYGF